MANRLQQIVSVHRQRAASDERSLDALVEQAHASPRPRSFAGALRGGSLAVIAEVKRRSPSIGDLDPGLDAVALAGKYEAGGAMALSVLTDEKHFGGSSADLQAARAATSLPLLRKDFTVDLRDIADARIMGADAVLLIVAALTDAELWQFQGLAEELELTALVEVHDKAEITRAAAIDATVIGVNQRDLTTFSIDPGAAERLRLYLPAEVITVAESGIGGADQVRQLAELGYDAALIGSAVVTAPDPEQAVRLLADAGRST